MRRRLPNARLAPIAVSVGLVLGGLALPGPAWARGADGRFEERSSSHFVLLQDVGIDQRHGFRGSRRFEQQVLAVLEGGYDDLDRRLGLRPRRPMTVFIYDPAVGMTERGSFLAIFEALFTHVYGMQGADIWQYQLEFGTGMAGLAGRQLSLEPDTVLNPQIVELMNLMEQHAGEGRITAVANSRTLGELRWHPEDGSWTDPAGVQFSGAELRALVGSSGETVTLTAELPGGVSIGGADRQPLLDVDPDLRVLEEIGQPPSLPRPLENTPSNFRLLGQYVDAEAVVLVNGDRCSACSFTQDVSLGGLPVIDLDLPLALPAGVHALQVQNPSGWISNEMPICVTNEVDVCVNSFGQGPGVNPIEGCEQIDGELICDPGVAAGG